MKGLAHRPGNYSNRADRAIDWATGSNLNTRVSRPLHRSMAQRWILWALAGLRIREDGCLRREGDVGAQVRDMQQTGAETWRPSSVEESVVEGPRLGE